jgi:hypothetical protein
MYLKFSTPFRTEPGMLEVYRAGSLMSISKELSKYKLYLMAVQVRWEGSGTEPAGEYTFFYGKGSENHEFVQGFLYIIESYQSRGSSLLVIGCHT